MNKNRLRTWYFSGWLLYILYIYIDNLVNHRGSQPYVWSNLASSFVEFSFCFFFVYPKFLKVKTIPLLIGGLLLADVLFMASRCLIEEVVYVWLIGHGNYTPDTTVLHYINDNWWRALQPIILSFIAWALMDTFKKEQENEKLRREKTQAELLFLKTQINPHFLYNTLNYIYSLAYPVSDELASAIIKLSQLMRYMLTESADGGIALDKEIDYLENYIDIYRLRFEDKFFVDFKVNGDLRGKKIASLILIPFVENAFKHGVADDATRPIKINISLIANRLTLTVSNKINRGQKDTSSGIGLANIGRRLKLIYPDKHELLIADNGETYKTTLNIILN